MVLVLINIYEDRNEIKSKGKIIGLINKMKKYEFVFIAQLMKLVVDDKFFVTTIKRSKYNTRYIFYFECTKPTTKFKREWLG